MDTEERIEGMRLGGGGFLRLVLAIAASVLFCTAAVGSAPAAAGSAAAAGKVPVRRMWMPAPAAPGTPSSFNLPGTHLHPNLDLNQVGVIKVGSKAARNVLVFEPGTSAGAGYFVPFARSLVEKLGDWQVWSVERRENLLEDQTLLNKAKHGNATPKELFHYYLGYLAESPEKKPHMRLIPPGFVLFAREWGMNVAVEDLHTVIEAAKGLGGKVVLAGHSLGGSVVTAYATWDFAGKPGAEGLSALVYDDGGSGPTPVSKEKAEEELTKLNNGSPWLAFGGIGSPFLGLFSALGAMGVLQAPEEASLAESFPLLPTNLKPKNGKGELLPVTNEAEFGFGVNVGSSPPTLLAAQVHAGKGLQETAKEDGLIGWNNEGAISPLHRYAEMLAGAGLRGADGNEWYFPERLTIDTGAVAEGNANPAQEVLGEHAIHGHELPSSLKILAISTELDKVFGVSSLTAAQILAEQSGIPSENVTLIDRESEYSHNDPNAGDPNGEIEGNIFYKEMVPFLEGIAP
jgi:pimeloyl-ACP methyl ester carboxylesterase